MPATTKAFVRWSLGGGGYAVTEMSSKYHPSKLTVVSLSNSKRSVCAPPLNARKSRITCVHAVTAWFVVQMYVPSTSTRAASQQISMLGIFNQHSTLALA